MLNSKENALLYYSGFLALKQKLDFIRAKNALRDIWGKPPFHPAVTVYENGILFFDDYESNQIVIENGKTKHTGVGCRLQGVNKHKITSKLNQIYQNIVEKTVSYNYGSNETVKTAFENAILSETKNFLPINVNDIVKNKDWERASIFLFLSTLYQASCSFASDTMLIDSMRNGFLGLPQVFHGTRAFRGIPEHMVLIDHTYIKGDSLGSVIKNKDLRSVLLGLGVSASATAITSFGLMDIPMAFVSSFALMTGFMAWRTIKNNEKQAQSIREQTMVLSCLDRSVIDKSYLLSDQARTSVLYAQEKTLSRLNRLEYHQTTSQFVRDAISKMSREEHEKITIFDVLNQKENLSEIHQDAFQGVSISQLFKKYPKEDVYQWMRVVDTFCEIGQKHLKNFIGDDDTISPDIFTSYAERLIGGKSALPTRDAMAIAISLHTNYLDQLKGVIVAGDDIKKIRKKNFNHLLNSDKEYLAIHQQCSEDLSNLLKENPRMTSEEICYTLFNKWIYDDPDGVRIKIASQLGKNIHNMFFPSTVVKIFIRSKILSDIEGRSKSTIYEYADEMALTLRKIEKYKKISQTKSSTVEAFLENEHDDFDEIIPYQLKLSKPVKIHPKTQKMLKQAKMDRHLLSRTDD